MRVHEFFKEKESGFSISTTRGKLAEYDFLQPTKRKQTFIDNLKSSVPLLSDHYQGSTTHQAAALPNAKLFYRSFEKFNKKSNGIGNIFNQSEYQNRLKHKSSVDQSKVPLTHHSLNKIGSNSYMHIKDAYAKIPSVQAGRNRNFYTSQIF
jgi:hypothetical protein